MNSESAAPMRLQRYLARAGVASRRASERLMAEGRVSVNGAVVTELGCKVVPGCDEVRVDGERVVLPGGAVYVLLDKPAGYITSMTDPQGRRCVSELVPVADVPGLFPVGRLDYDTTGALLFTNDGDVAHLLLHPSHHVEKTYEALVDGIVSDAELAPIRAGITLDDGPCKPAPCEIVRVSRGRRETLVRIVLSEGRKNQVKRMLSRIGHPVKRLNRSQFGPLGVEGMEPGAWRVLDENEVRELKVAARVEEA